MAKNFLDLHNARSPEARARVEARVQRVLAELPIQELQQARHLSQEQLAKLLFMEADTLSKLEHDTDIYISTLRSYIEAMGGKLDIIANFPDGEVQIKQFTDIKKMQLDSGTVTA
jgi:ribosome-binding protein aMBF1 (putative translation factor)